MRGLENASKPNRIKYAAHHLGQLLSGADGLFTAGTYAILLDYHRAEGAKLGLSGPALDTYAHQIAERETETVAQPTRMGNRSLVEITATHPLARLGYAFASENRQKLMLMAHSLGDAKANPAKAVKTFILMFGVGGLMTAVLKNLWREMKGDDDEEKWSVSRLAQATFINTLQGIPGMSLLLGENSLLAKGGYAGKSGLQLIEGEGDMKDVENLLWAAGLLNDTAAGVVGLYNAGADFAKVLANMFTQ